MVSWPLRIRFITGIILYLFTLTHLLNHAVGIFGLYPLEKARLYFLAFWRHPIMDPVVPLALLLHGGTVFFSVYKRHTLRGSTLSEIFQYVLGFGAPIFILAHILGTRMLHAIYGINDTYIFYLSNHLPMKIYLTGLLSMLFFLWGHGSLGIFHYIKTKKWYTRLRLLFITMTLVLPTCAALGTLNAAKDVENLMRSYPDFKERVNLRDNPQEIDVQTFILRFYPWAGGTYVSLVLLLFIGRKLRIHRAKEKERILVTYHDDKRVYLPQGATLLEASLIGKIPHTHFCGGKGRCTTCRVQILEGEENLSKMSELEVRSLDWSGADTGVRLACMTIPSGPVKMRPLVSLGDTDTEENELSRETPTQTQEKNQSALSGVEVEEEAREIPQPQTDEDLESGSDKEQEDRIPFKGLNFDDFPGR